MAATGHDDALITGRMFVSVEDGELALVALWWQMRGDVALMVTKVLDVRECGN